MQADGILEVLIGVTENDVARCQMLTVPRLRNRLLEAT